MKILTLDFESYYDKDYSLSKLTTEEYIRGPLFEVIGVAVQVDNGEPEWFSGTRKEIRKFLEQFDFANSLALAHNAVFDAAILTWCFGIKPKGWLDTLSMARAVHGTEVGGSLKALVEHYKLGEKGTEVVDALGMKRTAFSAEQLAKYGKYCENDVAITYALFQELSVGFPNVELRLIDLTVKMFSEPVLHLDTDALSAYKLTLEAQKAKLLVDLGTDEESLQSNAKFAEALSLLGVVPPVKMSLKTGKEAFAFAKNDEEFKELLEHENPLVHALVAARIGVKSTLEESRTQRFIDISMRGPMPVPLKYYAAHTGRWGGSDKINLQNLPSRGDNGGKLKKTILAPDGFMLIDCDSSQIEARTLAWLAGQDDLVEAFDKGQDVYKIMASAIYGKPVEEISKAERFVGKTTVLGCIGSGTMVLCGLGWKPIEEVTLADKLWDGKDWVCHQGLVSKGLKQTLNLCGVWLTPDHKVLSGTQWLEAQSVAQDESTLYQALVTGAENLPSQGMSRGKETGFAPSLLAVVVDSLNTPLTTKISKILKVLGAIVVQRAQQMVSGIGSTPRLCTTMPIGLGCLTDYLPRSLDAITKPHHTTPIMGVGVSKFINRGEKTGLRFLGMYKQLLGGMLKNLKWIAPTTTKDTNPAILGLYQEATTCGINVPCLPLRKSLQTYDIAYSGPRNRFTILTNQGPMIVHNCGYGMGAVKFHAALLTAGVTDITPAEAQRIIDVYRQTYSKIPLLWRAATEALKHISANFSTTLGRDGVLVIEGQKGIKLPNGLYVKYPNMKSVTNPDNGKYEVVYDTRKGKTVVNTRIYGGKCVENVCQALAKLIIGDQMLLIAKKYKVVMTVHDAVACIAPEDEVSEAVTYVEKCMRTRPSWALGLPLNCESGFGYSYGDC